MRTQACCIRYLLARSFQTSVTSLTLSVLAVYDCSTQPVAYRRLSSSSAPSQVPCTWCINHQRSGKIAAGPGGAGAAAGVGGSKYGAITSVDTGGGTASSGSG